MLNKSFFLITALLVSAGLSAQVKTANIHADDLKDPVFVCLDEVKKSYSPEEQVLVDLLWKETLIYLQIYADALTKSSSGHCRNSDAAIYDTTKPGFAQMCVMEREDMKTMVKHIYQIVNNPAAAKKCFDPRKGAAGLTMPGGELLAHAPVAQWLNRQTMDNYFKVEKTTDAVRKHGADFSKNFSKMVMGRDLVMPKNFRLDVSANSLPNLWASVGWVPMYAANSERNKRNFDEVRGGYAYAEVLGHWGLLRIDSINGEKVGAEVGMVVQQVDTFYPYHNHAVAELYYTIRQPACTNQFRSFAVSEHSPLLRTKDVTDKLREVELDTNYHNEQTAWASSEPGLHPLTYFHANTVHAFDIDARCEASPDEKAIVTVWARTNANQVHNDYGNTLLCESAQNPDTPAIRGEKIRCDLTNEKW